MSFPVIIVNRGSTIPTQQDMADVALALTLQSMEEFAREYGVSARVRAGTDADRQPGEWMMVLLPTLPVKGALGYHTTTDDGQPIMYVCPELDALDGVDWSTTASHELLETLGNPKCALTVRGPDGLDDFFEMCDAVEADSYEKEITRSDASTKRVLVSNFQLASWWSPPADATGVKYDHLGLCTTDHEIRPGGYSSQLHPDGTVTQAQHATQKPRAYRLLKSDVTRGAKCADRLVA